MLFPETIVITIKKIRTLKPRVRVRRLGEIFFLSTRMELDPGYVKEALETLLSEELLSLKDREDILYFYNRGDKEDYLDIYYRTLSILGESVADWDKVTEEGEIAWDERRLFDHYLYLDHLRSPYNVGSIFRSAEAFGVKKIFLSPGSASPLHERAKRTSRNTTEGVEWAYRELEEIEKPVFALELGGEDITSFRFPKDAVCIIGSEEDGVSGRALGIADKSLGRVSIRQYGVKGSINVASAVAILLQYWAKSEDGDGE